MNIFSSIGLFIKGLGLPVKIASGVIIGGVAVGGATTAVIVNTQPSTDNAPTSSEVTNTESSVAAEDNHNSGSEPKNTEDKDDAKDSSKKDSSDEKAASSEKNETRTATATTTTNTNTANATAQQSTPNINTQAPAKKPDYNLNDKYVAGYETYVINNMDKTTGECKEIERKTFFGVGKFTGVTSDLYSATVSQYINYMKQHGYSLECGGMGATTMTWEDAIARGIALDEAKCAQYGLSCGRW